MNHSQEMELFWELSHAQYLTIPRSIIQEMDKEWQDKFAKLLDKLDETIDWRPQGNQRYWVAIDEENSFEDLDVGLHDPLAEYRHGNDYAKSLVKKPGD